MANDTAPHRAVVPRGRPAGPLGRGALLAVLVVAASMIGWGMAGGIVQPIPSGADSTGEMPGGSGSSPQPTGAPLPTPTPRPPIGGTELYGYLPYWQMTARMETYLAQVPVSTLALFSVSADGDGGIRKNEIGYRRITGARGRGLIADAHARGQRVELVFTSFGYALNTSFFGADAAAEVRSARAARELLALAADLGVDGINVDVERVQGDISLGYASFMAALEAGLPGLGPHATLSVATTADHGGAILARAAIMAGADRVFLMGYDYHWSGSAPGASSPIHNLDSGRDLMQSIVDYVETGVPRDRILLGLPLYGMSWPVAGPDQADVALGKGTAWIPSNHADLLTAPDFIPTLDLEGIAEYFIIPDGDAWAATYYDSPRTLRAKLDLARSQGLAGSGFWALGYEVGLPGYLDLMRDFRAGRIGG